MLSKIKIEEVGELFNNGFDFFLQGISLLETVCNDEHELRDALENILGEALPQIPEIDEIISLIEHYDYDIQNYLSIWILGQLAEWNEDIRNNITEIESNSFAGTITTAQLPSNMVKLTNLKYLSLVFHDLTALPDWIGSISSLEVLYLESNRLTHLPDSIGNLTNLRELYISENFISILPDSIGNLTNLEYLQLHTNDLEAIPETIARLTNLTFCGLNGNHLTNLPSLEHLTSLQNLLLGSNEISDLPTNIPNLVNLDIENNQITNLPEEISELSTLKTLNIKDNPIPPQEIERFEALLPNCTITH